MSRAGRLPAVLVRRERGYPRHLGHIVGVGWFTRLMDELSDLRQQANKRAERIVERESPNPELQARIAKQQTEISRSRLTSDD